MWPPLWGGGREVSGGPWIIKLPCTQSGPSFDDRGRPALVPRWPTLLWMVSLPRHGTGIGGTRCVRPPVLLVDQNVHSNCCSGHWRGQLQGSGECHLVTCNYPWSRDAHPGPGNRTQLHLTSKGAAVYCGCHMLAGTSGWWDRISLTRRREQAKSVHQLCMTPNPS